jgi:hypothetical protein
MAALMPTSVAMNLTPLACVLPPPTSEHVFVGLRRVRQPGQDAPELPPSFLYGHHQAHLQRAASP